METSWLKFSADGCCLNFTLVTVNQAFISSKFKQYVSTFDSSMLWTRNFSLSQAVFVVLCFQASVCCALFSSKRLLCFVFKPAFQTKSWPFFFGIVFLGDSRLFFFLQRKVESVSTWQIVGTRFVVGFETSFSREPKILSSSVFFFFKDSPT